MPEKPQPPENEILKDWQRFGREQSDLWNKLWSKANEEDQFDWLENKMSEFIRTIKESYEDHREYVGFHVLVGSTLPPEADQDMDLKIDFPGDLSVKKFLDDLAHQLEIE